MKIRQDPTCEGILLPNNKKAKISQFVDDKVIISNSVQSLKSILLILEKFGSLSGLRINKKKNSSKAMLVRVRENQNIKDTGIREFSRPN